MKIRARVWGVWLGKFFGPNFDLKLVSMSQTPRSKYIMIFAMFNGFTSYTILQLKWGLAGSNLDLLCIQQLDAAPFCENYAKLYFDGKHLEKVLNKGW